MEALEITCKDCGAVYKVAPEQIGKLLHCKCGRYLVAATKGPAAEEDVHEFDVSAEHSQEPEPAVEKKVIPMQAPVKAAPPAPAPAADAPVEIKLKNPLPTTAPKPAVASTPPTAMKTQAPKANAPEAKAPPKMAPAQVGGSQTKLMIGAAAVVIVLAAAFFVMRGRSGGDKGPAKHPAQASLPATAPTNATTAAAPGGCSANPARLENGTSVAHSLLGSGMGKLEVENQTPSDVTVRLVNEGSLTVAWLYVQQGQSATISTVPLGTHRLMYSAGSDWDAQNLTFRCDDTYAEWDKPLDYSERRDDYGTVYASRKVVLGKTKVASISKDDFLKGHIGR